MLNSYEDSVKGISFSADISDPLPENNNMYALHKIVIKFKDGAADYDMSLIPKKFLFKTLESAKKEAFKIAEKRILGQ